MQSRRRAEDTNRRRLGLQRAAIAAVALSLLALAACGGGVLEPRGPVGLAQRTILIDSLVIMLAIVVPTIIATLAFAWWYRASNTKARYLPNWSFSGQIELVVWSIPVMVVILLAGVTWIGSHELDPARPLSDKVAPVEIEVVSLDWKWLFIHRDGGVASVNELVMPAGVPVRFTLTSASVMNAFFVPQLGSMIYTMNGMTTQLNLQADAPGVFQGMSSHFSGEGFADMNFAVHAVPAAEYAAWLAATKGKGPSLDASSYSSLLKQSVKVPVSTYGAVDPELFAAIAMQKAAPGPGPQTDHGGAAKAPKEER